MRYVSCEVAGRQRRSGVVLLIVMAMLALFASVALSFVYYADSEALSSQLNMDSLTRVQADLDPEAIAAICLRDLLYPSENTSSSLRGHELGRTMYGYNPLGLNYTPYNSPGRAVALSYPDPNYTSKILTIDNKQMVNYTYYINPAATPADAIWQNVLRTPEFYDKILMGPANAPPQPSYNTITAPYRIPPKLQKATYRYVGGANPPWTAYDTNNLMLSQISQYNGTAGPFTVPAGTVLMPSGYRPWNYVPAAGSDPRLFQYTSLRPDMGWNYVPPAILAANPSLGVNNVTLPDPRYPNGASVLTTSFLPPDSEFWPSPATLPNPVFPGQQFQLYGGPDVKNLDFGPGTMRAVTILPTTAVQKGPVVTVHTLQPHGYSIGSSVVIWGPMTFATGQPLASPAVAGSPVAINVTATPTPFSFSFLAIQPQTPPAPPFQGLAAGSSGMAWDGQSFYNNDSYWMYTGYPVMRAPNGKKYTMLVAPLVMDVNNRVHLGVHGNNLANNGQWSVSNQGFGPSEVNPNVVLQSPVPIAPFPSPPKQKPPIFGAVPVAGNLATITTGLANGGGTVSLMPHGFNVGDWVIITDVTNTAFNTTAPVQVLKVPTASSFQYAPPPGGKLAVSGNGYVYRAEFKFWLDRRYGGTFYGPAAAWNSDPRRLFPNWSYGGVAGVTTSMPIGPGGTLIAPNGSSVPAAQAQAYQGTFNSRLDMDGLNNMIPGVSLSSTPPLVSFITTSAKAVGGSPIAQQMQLNAVVMAGVDGFNANITPGMNLVVGVGAQTELVQVQNVNNYNPSGTNNTPLTITAVFTKNHPANTPVTTQPVTTTAAPIVKGMQTVPVTNASGGPPIYPSYWAFQTGMNVTVDFGGANAEPVVLTSASATGNTITGVFAKNHAPGAIVTVNPMPFFPSYSPGYNNIVDSGLNEIGTNKPLAYSPNGPAAPNARPIPSDVEALFRFTGTNGPATLSELFRIMPNTLINPASRNSLTLASNHFDRIAAAPALASNRTNPGNYVFNYYNSLITTNTSPAPPPNAVTPGLVIKSTAPAGLFTTITTYENHNLTALNYVAFSRPNGVGSNTYYPPLTSPPTPPAAVTLAKKANPTSFMVNNAQLATWGYTPAAGDIVTMVPYYGSNTSLNTAAGAPPYATPTSPWNSDYSADWRSTLGNFLKINLYRPLTNFPAAPVAGGQITALPSLLTAQQALADRQQLARDIYNALVRVTGVQDPNVAYPLGYATVPAIVQQNDFVGARWLGQLAVNIVDYIDNDDYITPFQWYAPAAGQGEWVFGTELPRLVINEVYGQQETAGNQVNFWTELYNPFNSAVNSSNYPRDNGIAYLQQQSGTTKPIYLLDVCQNSGIWSLGAGGDYRGAANNIGSVPAVWYLDFDYENYIPPKGKAQVYPPIGGNITLSFNGNNKTFAYNAALATNIQTWLQGFVNNGVDSASVVELSPFAAPPLPAVTPVAPFKIVVYQANPAVFPSLTLIATNLVSKGGPAPLAVVRPISTWIKTMGTAATPWTGVQAVGPSNGATNSGPPIGPVAIDPVPKKVGGIYGAVANGNQVTITTAKPHGFSAGQAVTIANVLNPSFNGTFVINAFPLPAGNTFTYTIANPLVPPNNKSGGGTATAQRNDANNGYFVVGSSNASTLLPNRNPQLPYTTQSAGMTGTFSSDNIQIKTSTGGAVTSPKAALSTITTIGPHNLSTGQSVTISGVGVPGYATLPNTPLPVTVLNPTQFTYIPPGGMGLAASGGGTVTPQALVTNASVSGVAMMLRRLANPTLAPQTNPALPLYNPYVTVDYVSTAAIAAANIPSMGLPVFSGAGTGSPTGFSSWGREQAYSGVMIASGLGGAQAYDAQQSPSTDTTQAKNSFFQSNMMTPAINSTAATKRSNWPIHLDRPPVNPLELLYVSAYRPYELTQQFVSFSNTLVGTIQSQSAPWNTYAGWTTTNNNLATLNQAAQNTMIYRLLDMVGTPPRMNGSLQGGRWPGNININTTVNPSVFQALCDPQNPGLPQLNVPGYLPQSNAQGAPLFNAVDVANVYSNLVASRQGPSSDVLPPVSDGQPFKGFASGNFNDTVLRANASGTAPVFFPSATGKSGYHPYQSNALLQKIYNNITMTSSTFAVWFTVGFFEVLDDSVQPPRIGQEIGRSQNRQIRHRFFSLVDRSGMTLFQTTSKIVAGSPQILGTTTAWSAQQSYNKNATVVFTNPFTNVTANYISQVNNNQGNRPDISPKKWTEVFMTFNPPTNLVNYGSSTSPAGKVPTVQVGMLLELIDPIPANSEVVAVTSVNNAANPTQFTANFVNNHNNGPVTIICRGNPGPQPNYNPHKDSNVVLHLSVIK